MLLVGFGIALGVYLAARNDPLDGKEMPEWVSPSLIATSVAVVALGGLLPNTFGYLQGLWVAGAALTLAWAWLLKIGRYSVSFTAICSAAVFFGLAAAALAFGATTPDALIVFAGLAWSIYLGFCTFFIWQLN